ncbi:MAG: tripartite tricarboxylate transporter substrate binding protein [bacterium]|nr:tripartite tricarboxylate transporter substrate binding protein [bacterium]
MKKALLIVFLALGMSMTGFAYPDRPVTIVVPYNAGGSSDMLARLFAQFLKKELGQPVTVTNRPGASGTIGAKAFLKMRADGYSVFLFGTSGFLGPIYQGREAIDATKFRPVAGFSSYDRILFVRSDAPYQTFKEFVSYARTNPGKLKFGSAGSLDLAYIVKYIFHKEKLDINVTHFAGGAPAIAALMGNHVDMIDGSTGSPAYTAAKAGKLTPIAFTTNKINPRLSHLKTTAELGYDYAATGMVAFYMHANAPDEAQRVFAAALQKVLKNKMLVRIFASKDIVFEFFTNDQLTEAYNDSKKLTKLYDMLRK